jgi:hypothetical protein
MSDLHDQHTAFAEVLGRAGHDPPHEIQPVFAPGKRERRFASILQRELAHGGCGDVRGIRENQVVAAAGEACEEVGLDEIDSPLQAVVRDVTLRDFERGAGNVCGVDVRARKSERREDREATRARAEIQHSPHAKLRSDPWRELLPEQFRDVRPRHDRAFVDVEPMLAEPRFAQEISGGLAGADAFFHERTRGLHFTLGQASIWFEPWIADREPERVQNQPCGFIARVRRAMAEANSGRVEPSRGFAQELPQRVSLRTRALSRAHPG